MVSMRRHGPQPDAVFQDRIQFTLEAVTHPIWCGLVPR